MFSVLPTVSKMCRATPARAEQRHFPSFAGPPNGTIYAVEDFAPTSRVARQLGEAGVESGTLQEFLARSPNPATQQQRHFYFVDESSLVSTNQIRKFLARLGPNDRVLLIGDRRQHQGVEAGRPFAKALVGDGLRIQRLGASPPHVPEQRKIP
jgi:ATP-dependent exoDNAse (exonuclease V) alpha subunit